MSRAVFPSATRHSLITCSRDLCWILDASMLSQTFPNPSRLGATFSPNANSWVVSTKGPNFVMGPHSNFRRMGQREPWPFGVYSETREVNPFSQSGKNSLKLSRSARKQHFPRQTSTRKLVRVLQWDMEGPSARTWKRLERNGCVPVRERDTYYLRDIEQVTWPSTSLDSLPFPKKS